MEIIMIDDLFFENVDPRKKQSLYESRMIQEDRNAMSNMPPKSISKTYDSNKYVEHLNMYNQSQKWRG